MNLKQIIDDKLYELYKDKIPQEIKERVEVELNMISDNEIEYQYLIAYKIAEKAKSDGRIMIERVCGASYIAYLLGITFVNPIEYYIDYDRCFKPITFDLEFAEDYFQIILEYTKEIFKEYDIEINSEAELKKHNIYLNTFYYCKILEELESKIGKNRKDIDLTNEEIYKYLINKEKTILSDSEMKIVEFLLNNHFVINHVQHVATAIGLERSTITDKLSIDPIVYYHPIHRETIYSTLRVSGLDKKEAYEIMMFISKGKQQCRKHEETWKKYISIMEEHNMINEYIGDEYINYCSKIHYLFPKAYSINRAIIYVWLTYYKMHHPKIYKNITNR